jgi:uncharacterized protein (DUF1501 family)
MKRRKFLKYGSALSALPLVLHGQPIFGMARNPLLESLTSKRPDRKLVLVQLNGGNDGLNTFVPMDQYGNLQKARPNIIIPENKLIPFTETLGLHPAAGKIKSLSEEEKCLVIQGVGYPQPNLSHFRSKDIITTGSSAGEVLKTGWMGRMLNSFHPEYPANYPNETYPHPIALTIGSSNSPTCQGYTSNLSAVIKNLNTAFQSPGGSGSYPETPFGKELEYIEGVMKRTEVYLEGIAEVASRANNLSTLYPESGNRLSDQLKIVARLIAGGLNTQVYVVSLGGWDTHAGQTEEGVPEGGKHRDLLSKLSDALYAFQDDLMLLGIEDDVLGMVYTEFGRRIKSNASFGTDHGTAWPAILFGSKVNPTILGSNPLIPAQVEKKDNLAMQFDFRDLYASVYSEWFESEHSLIESVLFGQFESLPILKSTTEVHQNEPLYPMHIFPNPVSDLMRIEAEVQQGKCILLLYSATGQQIKTVHSSTVNAGQLSLDMNLSFLESGSYFLGLVNGSRRQSTPFVKL